MVHMPSLEIWEWGLKIFCGMPTLTTHVNHLLFTQHKQHKAANLVHMHLKSSTEKMVAVGIQRSCKIQLCTRPLLVVICLDSSCLTTNGMQIDPFMHMRSYTNTILAKQCFMSSHKLLEKNTQFTVPKSLFNESFSK